MAKLAGLISIAVVVLIALFVGFLIGSSVEAANFAATHCVSYPFTNLNPHQYMACLVQP